MSMRHPPEHRSQHRLVRRWRRRLRIAAPFLSLPLLLGMLVLSVDLIEYRPEEPPERLSERPIPPSPQPKSPAASDQRSISTASVAQPEAIPLTRPQPISPTALELDLDLRLPELDLPPVPDPARP